MNKTVYIAHPLRGDVPGNIKRVNKICQTVYASDSVIPLSPIHAFRFLDPTGNQFVAMQHCLTMLSRSDEL
jgi:hypothetical protein